MKEALLEKLELEKRALQVVERLLEDSVAQDFLIDCTRFITPAKYKDAVEERSIAKLCGYPICANRLGKIPTQQYKISTKTNKVYDITERKLYCSSFCYKASKQYELQISKTPLWLRKNESPTEITLMKKGDSGSFGEEIQLSDRRLQEEDVEHPSSTQADAHNSDLQNEDSANSENEFVSSVVTKQRTGPRVHWGDLPKHADGKPPNTAAQKDKIRKAAGNLQENKAVHEAATQLTLCSLSENIQEAKIDSKLDNTSGITQVGMSKKGAAGLRNLLKQTNNSIRDNLLECLKKTLREWRTDETATFLYGADGQIGKRFGEVKEEEEALDEDDIEEEEGGGDEERQTAAAPDYDALKREAQDMELRVREFYKGTWVPSAEGKHGGEQSTEQPVREPVLPLVDSKAQHLIQKKITVDKLSSCLKNIIGTLGLTMSDVSTDLNNLVRTFRFTNTNIIHKTPEWTVIAVVLLHL